MDIFCEKKLFLMAGRPFGSNFEKIRRKSPLKTTIGSPE
jgi:hypothetical protein